MAQRYRVISDDGEYIAYAANTAAECFAWIRGFIAGTNDNDCECSYVVEPVTKPPAS